MHAHSVRATGTVPAMNSPSDPKVGLHLEVLSGNGAGSEILVEDELVIGRHATGAGKLADDSEISRQHARISREVTGDYAIEDLGSSNGTFVNGLQIFSPRLLALGDSIELGATALVVRSIVREAPAPAPAPAAAESGPGYAPTVLARSPVIDVPPAVPSREEATAESMVPAPLQEPEPEPAAPAPPPPAVDDTAKSLTPQWPPPPEPVAPPAVQPEPAATTEEAQPVPRLELTLEIDFDERRARLGLGDGDAVTLVLQDGRWQAQTGQE